MEVRKIEIDEIYHVLDLIDEFDRPISKRPNEEEFKKIFNKLISVGGCVIGAFIDNSMVGTCTLNICPNFSWAGRSFAIIENVIVTQKQRNKGIGKAIIKFAQKLSEESGCYKVALTTGTKSIKSHGFYESVGFIGSKIGFQKRFGT